MPLPSTGPISLKGLRDEYEPGYTGTISLSRYTVGGGAGVTIHSGAAIPAKGQAVGLSKFRGTFKLRPPAFAASIPAQTGDSSAGPRTFNIASSFVTTTYSSAVTYSLAAGSPGGVSIDSATGAITVAAGSTVTAPVTVIATGPTGLSSSTIVYLNVFGTDVVTNYTTIATRQVSFYDTNVGGGNTNKWYDYNSLLAKYPVGTYFYLRYQSNYFRLRFEAAENPQIRSTIIQKLSSVDNASWVTPGAGDLPVSTVMGYPTTVEEVPNPIMMPILRFDASLLAASTTVGAPVTSWTNQGSWGATYKAVGYNYPTLGMTPGTSNNVYFVNFNRAQSQYFNITSTLPFNWLQNGSTYQGFTIFIVARYNGGPGFFERFIDWGPGGLTDSIIVCRAATSNMFTAKILQSSAEIAPVDSTVFVDDGQFHVYIVSVTNASGLCKIDLYMDSSTTTVGSNTSATPLTNKTATVNYIGRSVVGSDMYLNGDIAEIQVFNTTLSDTDRGTVFSAIQSKYGLSSTPIPPPYINLDARSLTTSVRTGGNLSTWTSPGTTVIAATAYNSTALSKVNGLPAVSFNRSLLSYVDLGSLAMNWFVNGSTYKGATIFVVGQYQGTAGFYERWIDFGNSRESDNIILARNDVVNRVYGEYWNGSSAVCVVASPQFTEDNGIHIYVSVLNNASTGSSLTVFRDATTFGSTASSATPINNRSITKGYVGRSNWNDAYLNGNIYQILMFDSALDSASLANVYSKLRSKWSAATTPFPPGPMTANSTALSDGTYVASSPSAISTEAFKAFDQNASTQVTYNSSGQAQYDGTTGAYLGMGQFNAHWYFKSGASQSNNGDFVQIQMPNTILLSSYAVTANTVGGSGFPTRNPRSFVLLGSVDGAVWYWIDERTGLTWTNGEVKTFTTPQCDAAYSYFKLVDYLHNAGDNVNFLIGDIRFYGAYSTQNLPTATMTQWPSAPFASATTTDSVNYTTSLTEGQYTVTVPASPAVATGFEPWKIFDGNSGNTGGANYAGTQYNASTGAYLGSNSTTYYKGGTALSRSGDWVQLRLPSAIQVCYFALTVFFNSPNKSPRSFVLLGSNNGSSWTWIDEETALFWGNQETKVFAVSAATSSTYSYFRLVDYAHNGGADNASSLIGNLVLYGNTSSVAPTKLFPFAAPIAAYDNTNALWTSTTVPDVSGNQRPITMTATPVTGSWPPCIQLDRAVTGATTTFTANWYAWSVEMVIYISETTTGTFYRLAELPSTFVQWNASDKYLYFWDRGKACFRIPLQLQTWYHIVMLSDGTYYLNNVKGSPGAGLVPLAIANGSSTVRIGSSSGTEATVQGGIGLFRIYDRIISEAQVAANYAIIQPIYLAAPTVPVAAYDNNVSPWTGTTNDLTGNARTMTFAGGTPTTISSPPHMQLENAKYAATSSLSVNWASWSVEVVAYMSENNQSRWNLVRLPSTTTFQWDLPLKRFISALNGGTVWPVTLQPYTWYHLVFRSDGTIYVNSSKTTGGPVYSAGALTGPLYIGFGDNASTVYTLDGGLGLFRVYDRLLTDAQVQTHYNAIQNVYWGPIKSVVSYDNITALWSGATVADLSGNGRSLTMSGTRVTSSSPPYLALADDTMGTTTTLSPMGSIWSMEFALFVSDTSANATFVGRLYGFSIQWNASNKQLSVWNGVSSSVAVTLQLNTWYHLVLLSNGTYYLNNVKTTGGTSPGGLKYTFNQVTLGNSDATNKTALGGMGVFRVYNSLLTDAHVQTNYNVVQPIYLASPAVPVFYYDATVSAWDSTATDLVPGSTRTMTFAGTGTPVTTLTVGTKKFIALSSTAYATATAFSTDFRGGWSIEFLVNITDYTSGFPFVCFVGTAGSGTAGLVQYDGSKLYYWNGTNRFFDLTVSRNTWYHVIMQSDGTCFVNGTRYARTAPTNNATANVTITPTIGTSTTNGTIQGQMAMLRVYNQAVGSAAALTNFSSYATSFAIPYMPVIYYDVTKSAWASSAADWAPYGANMTFNTAVTTTTNGALSYATLATATNAVVGSAISVDFTAGWAVEILFNITGYPDTFPAICQPRVFNGGTGGQVIYNGATGAIYLQDESQQTTTTFVYTTVSQNTWNHLIMQSDGTYYLNGVRGTAATVPTNNNTGVVSITPTIGWNIKSFTGQMAVFRMYNRVIDNATALSNYNDYRAAYGINVTSYPPSSLKASFTSVSSTMQNATIGNGAYTVTSSSAVDSSSIPINVFNKANALATDVWASAAITNPANPFPFPNGEWIQVQLASSVQLVNYVLAGRGDTTPQNPSGWVLGGSVDGTNWVVLDIRPQSSPGPLGTGSTPCTFAPRSSAVSGTAFSYFRIVFPYQTAGSSIGIGEWTLNGTPVTVVTRLFNIHPPAALTTFNTVSITNQNATLSGTPYGAGTYIATSSSTWSGNGGASSPIKVFDRTLGSTQNLWASHQITNPSNPSPLPAGDWLQVQLPSAIKLGAYAVSRRGDGNNTQWPFGWTLGGSTDGTTWTVLDTQSAMYMTLDTSGYPFTVTLPSNASAFSYYRIVFACNTGGYLGIGEWILYSTYVSINRQLYVTAYDNNETLWTGAPVVDMSSFNRNLTTFTGGTPVTQTSPPHMALEVDKSFSTAAMTVGWTDWSVEMVLYVSEVTPSSSHFVARLFNWNIQFSVANNRLYLWSGTTSFFNITLQRNIWYHVVLQSNGTYFVNNIKTVGGSGPGALNRSSSTITLGGSYTVNGGMGLFRIYDRLLSDAEVSSAYSPISYIYSQPIYSEYFISDAVQSGSAASAFTSGGSVRTVTGLYSGPTNSYTGSTSLTVDGISIAGVYLYVKLSTPAIYNTYSYTVGADSPYTYIVIASNNGITWTGLNERFLPGLSTTGSVTYNFANVNAYLYYGVIVRRIYGSVVEGTANFQSWYFGASRPVSGPFVRSSDYLQYFSSSLVGGNDGDGFLSSGTGFVRTIGGLYSPTPGVGQLNDYVGPSSIRISGTTIRGVSFVVQPLTSRTYTGYSFPFIDRDMPGAWYIAGSNDGGATWTYLHDYTLATTTVTGTATYSFTNTTSYRLYVVVITKVTGLVIQATAHMVGWKFTGDSYP